MDMNQKYIHLKKFFARHLLFVFLLFMACCLLFTEVSFAAGGGGEDDKLMGWLWKIVNFALLVFLIVLVAKNPARNYFGQRKALIEKNIKESKEAKELAEKALAEIEERLKLKDKEFEEIISASQSSGEKKKEWLIEEGEKLRIKILEQAKTNIDYELKKAKDVIAAEAAEASLQLAEEKIKDRLTAEDQDRLMHEALAILNNQPGTERNN